MWQKQVDQDELSVFGKDIVKRQLVEIHHEWTCSRCGFQFYTPGCILDGLTLSEMLLHLKTMREREFAMHICVLHS
jgi:hypothetical protein